MKRGLVLILLFITMMSNSAFATSEDLYSREGIDTRYSSVGTIQAQLTKSGSSAVCNIGVTQKINLDSITGTLKLVDSTGKTISTKTGTFTKHGTVFTLTKSFTMPNAGTYKVKFTLVTYKGGVKKETITGETNTVKK